MKRRSNGSARPFSNFDFNLIVTISRKKHVTSKRASHPQMPKATTETIFHTQSKLTKVVQTHILIVYQRQRGHFALIASGM